MVSATSRLLVASGTSTNLHRTRKGGDASIEQFARRPCLTNSWDTRRGPSLGQAHRAPAQLHVERATPPVAEHLELYLVARLPRANHIRQIVLAGKPLAVHRDDQVAACGYVWLSLEADLAVAFLDAHVLRGAVRLHLLDERPGVCAELEALR